MSTWTLRKLIRTNTGVSVNAFKDILFSICKMGWYVQFPYRTGWAMLLSAGHTSLRLYTLEGGTGRVVLRIYYLRYDLAHVCVVETKTFEWRWPAVLTCSAPSPPLFSFPYLSSPIPREFESQRCYLQLNILRARSLVISKYMSRLGVRLSFLLLLLTSCRLVFRTRHCSNCTALPVIFLCAFTF